MLGDIVDEINVLFVTAERYLYPWLICLATLWGINILNWLTGSWLNVFGIFPRHMLGLLGIFISPILHKNFNHLFFNTVPLFFLGIVILARGPTIFLEITLIIVVLSGLLVWLFGRRALHIGASGLVSGYFGYILITAYTNPSFSSLLLAVVVAYYFGGIFLGIFPQEEKISWESHLFGFLSGIMSAYIRPYM